MVEQTRRMSTAREDILGRVTASVRNRPGPQIRREYRRVGRLSAVARAELFCSRVGEYRADVRRAGAGEVAETVAAVCRERSARRLVVPTGVPASWRPQGVELIEDTGLSPRDLDQLDGVLTGSTVAVAETGTIALTTSPSEGRRALTLVPDLHICVVEERRIVELLPEAMTILADLVLRDRRPVTLVSGPSATSDIELKRVEGVHGPRSLIVVMTEEEQ